MKKQMKKILVVVLALTMVLAMSASAFATESSVEAEQVTVKIYLQDVYRGDGSFDPIQSVWDSEAIEVKVDSGSTLRAAIEKAVTQENDLKAVHWETEYDLYLDSVTYMNYEYQNVDNYYYDTETGESVYDGTSWLYFYGTPAQMPASSYDYPADENLTEKTVTSDTTLTLSYEQLEYRWI